jgi:hypothetical protein
LYLLLAACSNNGGAFPQVADAPPFDYSDGEELRSRMHQLAFEIQRLDGALATDYEEQSPSQQSIIDTLRNIERIGETLQSGDLSSKHPFLLDGMDRFLADVKRAQWDASRSRYYMAGRISGGCASCHRASY